MLSQLNQINKIIEKINKNECVILPTDTLYGIAGNAYSIQATNQLYEIKKREFSKKLPVHYSSIDKMYDDIMINETFLKLAKYFWPGPLTIVVDKKKDSKLRCCDETVAIRIPNNEITLHILKNLNFPLFMPSANFSNEPTFQTFKDAFENLNIDGIEDDSNINQVASTIIKIDSNDEKVNLIRIGAIEFSEILSLL